MPRARRRGRSFDVILVALSIWRHAVRRQ